MTFDSAYGELPTPTRAGYSFAGWYLGGAEITSRTTVPTADDHTLVAHWTAQTYTVMFDANGGTVTPATKTVTFDSAYGELPTPTYPGLYFDGWYLGDMPVAAATVVTATGDHTLIAHWTTYSGTPLPPPVTTLTFETNGGSAIDEVRAVWGATVDLTRERFVPARNGYVFTGWYADAALSEPLTSVRLTGRKTVYAGWLLLAPPFDDVSPSEWFYDDVRYVYENDLMNGVSSSLFDPEGSASRAMIVTILWRLENKPVVNYAMTFRDVDEGAWYGEAVRWAAACGIVTGYDRDTFKPDQSITREQLAAILYRYAKHKEVDVSAGEKVDILSFDDAETVSEYAVPAMKWVCGAGILRGADGKLTPDVPATRAQLAAALHRFCKNILAK